MEVFVKDINVRPLQAGDELWIDKFRREYKAGYLELPHGLAQAGVETAVATKGSKPVGSLTAINAVVLDPFVKDPQARFQDVFSALLKLESVLSYRAQQAGAVDEYIAVPEAEVDYLRLLEHYGFKRTCQNCVIMRRALVPDHVPLLEDEEKREKARQEQLAQDRSDYPPDAHGPPCT